MPNIGEAKLIGATARELLLRPGLTGRVLAVVKEAVYLQASPHRDPPPSSTGEGEIVWLAQNHLPMHPRAICGDFDFSALNVRMSFKSDGACLRFGDKSTVQVADAKIWQLPTVNPTHVAPREIVMVRANELKDLTGSPLRNPVRSLRELVGLGEGLTPSGDDFIGGFFFAQWHLHKAYPDTTRWDQLTVEALIEYARTQTNVISHAILRDHARGQSIEPMHRMMVTLLHGEPLDAIMPHVHHLIGIGHTSGQEMMAGLITAILQNIRVDSSP